jgi:hypothetical protein
VGEAICLPDHQAEAKNALPVHGASCLGDGCTPVNGYEPVGVNEKRAAGCRRLLDASMTRIDEVNVSALTMQLDVE